jgi:hypothetical protein
MLDLDLSAAFDTVDLQSRQKVFCPRNVGSVRTSQSRGRLGLETYPRSRLGQLGQRFGLRTQRLGLDLGLGLQGLVHIPRKPAIQKQIFK